jgi:plastocyanin
MQELEEVEMEDVELTSGTVEVELKDFEFVPYLFHVKAGDVTFLFDNTATHAHNYRISAWDDHENVVYPGPKIGARRKRKVHIKLDPGVYYVFCNLSDHEDRGMVGKLFVEP